MINDENIDPRNLPFRRNYYPVALHSLPPLPITPIRGLQPASARASPMRASPICVPFDSTSLADLSPNYRFRLTEHAVLRMLEDNTGTKVYDPVPWKLDEKDAERGMARVFSSCSDASFFTALTSAENEYDSEDSTHTVVPSPATAPPPRTPLAGMYYRRRSGSVTTITPLEEVHTFGTSELRDDGDTIFLRQRAGSVVHVSQVEDVGPSRETTLHDDGDGLYMRRRVGSTVETVLVEEAPEEDSWATPELVTRPGACFTAPPAQYTTLAYVVRSAATYESPIKAPPASDPVHPPAGVQSPTNTLATPLKASLYPDRREPKFAAILTQPDFTVLPTSPNAPSDPNSPPGSNVLEPKSPGPSAALLPKSPAPKAPKAPTNPKANPKERSIYGKRRLPHMFEPLWKAKPDPRTRAGSRARAESIVRDPSSPFM